MISKSLLAALCAQFSTEADDGRVEAVTSVQELLLSSSQQDLQLLRNAAQQLITETHNIGSSEGAQCAEVMCRAASQLVPEDPAYHMCIGISTHSQTRFGEARQVNHALCTHC